MNKSSNKLPLIFIGLAVFAVIILIVLFFTRQTPTDSVHDQAVTSVETKTKQSDGVIFNSTAQDVTTSVEDKPTEIDIEEVTIQEDEDLIVDSKPIDADGKTYDLEFTPVEEAITELDSFFDYLDQQNYIQALNLPLKTKEIFSSLVQKLVDNPPVISGEVDDLFTLLKNTAHFFRILGEEHIILLKQIFINESDKIEPIAKNLFILFNHKDTLQDHYNITLTESSLYEYSSFFMNTMGGRLYMFRREMEIRMLVSYYSILFVDAAEENGLNNHGLDILPFVSTLTKEIENHGQNLNMRYKYLDKLYEIEHRLNR